MLLGKISECEDNADMINENRVALLEFKKIVLYVDETVKRAFHLLVTENILNQMNSHISNAHLNLTNFAATGIKPHLDSSTSNIQACFPILPQLAPDPSRAETPQKFAAILKKTASDYEGLLNGFITQIQGLRDEADAIKKEKDEFLIQRKTHIEEQIKAIDVAVGAQDLKNEELRKKLLEDEEESRLERNKKFQEEFKYYSKELKDTEKKYKKILAITSEKAQSDAYLRLARNANLERFVWQGLIMLTFALLVVLQVSWLPEFSTLWVEVTTRTVIGVAFLSVTFFCMKQASSKNKLYRLARLIGLELEILNGYLENFGDSKEKNTEIDYKINIRDRLVDKYFGNAIELEKSEDKLKVKTLNAVKEIVEIAGKLKNSSGE